ncbi:MAG TPA: hypothetical protein VE713_14190 [Pyrinomonadaceae bacterium]|jgi:hypothetical protein|nr:hypothetical protein [Pyrinomonadaceae bacterium]
MSLEFEYIKKFERGMSQRGMEFEIYRAKVPGGWLVAMKYTHSEVQGNAVNDWAWGYGYGGLTFIPDPNHEWQG